MIMLIMLSYHGKMVKKSDINAEHDGVIIDAPIDAVEEHYIYQILINNSLSDKLIIDIRVPVIGNVLDFVYLKEINRSEFKRRVSHCKLYSRRKPC